jgi:hypothetical protein
MLANPDIQPSASINQWIVSILTFHFTLVHVKGTFHSPDGLSRRPCQPADADVIDNKDEFDDWIDRLHSFVHMIQDERSPSPNFPYTPTFIAGAQISSEEEDDHYNVIPCSKIANSRFKD